MDFACHQCGECRGRAAIGYVHCVYTGRHSEQLPSLVGERFPVPLEARLIFPGLAFAYAMNSATELIGNDGLTSRTKISRFRPATGAMRG